MFKCKNVGPVKSTVQVEKSNLKLCWSSQAQLPSCIVLFLMVWSKVFSWADHCTPTFKQAWYLSTETATINAEHVAIRAHNVSAHLWPDTAWHAYVPQQGQRSPWQHWGRVHQTARRGRCSSALQTETAKQALRNVRMHVVREAEEKMVNKWKQQRWCAQSLLLAQICPDSTCKQSREPVRPKDSPVYW